MKFGKLSNVDKVDFSIPQLEITLPAKNIPNPRLYLGTTGWSNKEWAGSYYPKKAKASEFLYHYAELFNTIELNTTHYQIPSSERVQAWTENVKSEFNFCPKVPQVISHKSDLNPNSDSSILFFKSIENFKNNLGPCFMQLPEHFAPSQANQLLQFLESKPRNVNFAVELRHHEWFTNENQNLRLLAHELIQYNTSIVISDVAGRRDVCHSVLSTPTLIIRLVGNNLHQTDYNRMDLWIERIIEAQNSLEDIYVFFHQPSMHQIPEMVNYFIKQLEKRGLNSPISPFDPKYRENTQLTLF